MAGSDEDEGGVDGVVELRVLGAVGGGTGGDVATTVFCLICSVHNAPVHVGRHEQNPLMGS